MTRLNVYAGPAGFYLIRGGPDDTVTDTRTEHRPRFLARRHERTTGSRRTSGTEIPIAIQDRSFEADGSLFYPTPREFFDRIVDPYVPVGPFAPIWNPEFFGTRSW